MDLLLNWILLPGTVTAEDLTAALPQGNFSMIRPDEPGSMNRSRWVEAEF
jgi:hypothetical protein